MAAHRVAPLAVGLAVAGGMAAAAAASQEPRPMTPHTELATFAGGCFWCMQSEFDGLPGVLSTTVGYTGGTTPHPTYEEVSSGSTGHAEAIQIAYDPSHIRYEQLLEIYWSNVDPTTMDRQFADVGTQYRTAIFYHSEEQRRLAEASKQAMAQSGRFKDPIVTAIVPASAFYPAEEYHQWYSRKNPLQYQRYSTGSGRKEFLKRVWGRPAHP